MRASRLVRFALALTLFGSLAPGVLAAIPATTTRLTQRYEITATLDVAGGRLDAVERLVLTNRATHAIDHLNLSVLPRAHGYFQLRGTRVDGAQVAASWTTGTNLRVPLAGRLAPGETAVVVVRFGLRVRTSGGAFTARLSREAGVLSFGEWFPILSREHDSYGVGDPQVSYTAERIRLRLTTTAPLPRNAIACPGLVQAPHMSGRHWVCDARSVRDFGFVVNPAFRLATRQVGRTTIKVYTQTVSPQPTADRARRALTRLNKAYGRYPWPDLVLAEVGAVGGFSMEYPRMIHLTRSKVTDLYIINHEIAHQWFYAQLGNDQMTEPWLDEAFADFSARYLMGIGPNPCSSRDVDSPVFDWHARPISGGNWLSCDGYFHSVFYRGTEFLNAVRDRMGSSDFFAAVRAFVDAHRFEVITGRQLLDHLEAWDGAHLRPIYQRYLAAYDGPIRSLRPEGWFPVRAESCGREVAVTQAPPT